ncbi:hypothetical protein [Clostridium formicaceticum]|nr:hypothetical protein [Clostridium formicaceticum]
MVLPCERSHGDCPRGVVAYREPVHDATEIFKEDCIDNTTYP